MKFRFSILLVLLITSCSSANHCWKRVERKVSKITRMYVKHPDVTFTKKTNIPDTFKCNKQADDSIINWLEHKMATSPDSLVMPARLAAVDDTGLVSFVTVRVDSFYTMPAKIRYLKRNKLVTEHIHFFK